MKKISEAAKLYAREWSVLEQARSELNDALNDLWNEIWDEIKSQLDALQEYTGHQVRHKEFKDRGKFSISTKTRLAVNLKIEYCDSRHTDDPAKARVRLFAPADSRTVLKKQPDILDKLNALCDQHEVAPPTIEQRAISTQDIEISHDDAEMMADAIKAAIINHFELITEFEQWLIEQGESGE